MDGKQQKTLPAKTRLGYILIGIGSSLLLIMAVLAILILVLFAAFGDVDWHDQEIIVDIVAAMIIMVLQVAAAFAGFSYISHKKFLVWMVACAAIVFFAIFVYECVDFGMKIYAQSWEAYDIVGLVMIFVTQTIYFIGWMLSKDYFDD